MHKLASIALLYLALAFVFVLILGFLSYKEPQVISYLISGTPTLSFLTSAEQSHMHDVAQLLASGISSALFASLFVVGYSMYKPLHKVLVKDSFIMSLVLLMLLIPFNYTFTWFHQAFFPSGNWQFPADSWLITHFSESFFATIAAVWFVGTAVLLALLGRTLPQN